MEFSKNLFNSIAVSLEILFEFNIFLILPLVILLKYDGLKFPSESTYKTLIVGNAVLFDSKKFLYNKFVKI